MSSIESIVKYNAQTAGRERILRLFQYTTKFVNSILKIYYTRYAKGGTEFLEFIYKLRDLEKYLLSCRRLVNLGRCVDQFYSAVRSLQLYDPVTRTTLSTSKFWVAFQLSAEHVLWLHDFGFIKVDKQRWSERANKFWLYSISANLLRDLYELICLIQHRRTRESDNLESGIKNFTLSTPLKWAKEYPKLSCDIIKNSCDFLIPYSAINGLQVHPALISILGIISSTMGILQIYDKKYRLSHM